jgi:hypothetical protein
MTPGRASALVARWVRFYTRDLPAAVTERRVEEIGSDLHDHIDHERRQGTSDRRIALRILHRTTRGMAADLSWRRRIRLRKDNHVKSFVMIMIAPLVIAAVGVSAVVYGGDDDAPGLVLIGIMLIVGALALGVRTAQRSSR